MEASYIEKSNQYSDLNSMDITKLTQRKGKKTIQKANTETVVKKQRIGQTKNVCGFRKDTVREPGVAMRRGGKH